MIALPAGRMKLRCQKRRGRWEAWLAEGHLNGLWSTTENTSILFWDDDSAA